MDLKYASLAHAQSLTSPGFSLPQPWEWKKKKGKAPKGITDRKISTSNELPRPTIPPKPSASKPLPKLRANAFFPKYDTKDFDFDLDNAVHELQNDTTSGARQLADSALRHLAHFAELGAGIALTRIEFWTLMVRASRQLSTARPSMGAAVTACLLRALERIIWAEDQVENENENTKLADLAADMIKQIAKERQEVSKKLGESFTLWLKGHCEAEVRIVTLSNSSTIRAAILHALSSLQDVKFRLTILESRPRCEGADMAAQIYAAASEYANRLHIAIMPDCAVGQAVKDIDLILLGADRISSAGDVSNKIGSLPAAICAKSRNKNIAVAVLSDTDKIAAPGLEEESHEQHPPHELSSAWALDTKDQLEEGKENIDVFGEWFEWVPAQLIDAYVTEIGVLGVEHVEELAQEVKNLEDSIYGSSQE